MSDLWTTFKRAPPVGTVICANSEIVKNATHSVDLKGFPVILARHDDRLVAYVNACPHQFLPLDYRSANVISANGAMLRCSNHAAGFDLATGEGVEGHGEGCSLTPVPVHEDGGKIVVGLR